MSEFEKWLDTFTFGKPNEKFTPPREEGWVGALMWVSSLSKEDAKTRYRVMKRIEDELASLSPSSR